MHLKDPFKKGGDGGERIRRVRLRQERVSNKTWTLESNSVEQQSRRMTEKRSWELAKGESPFQGGYNAEK